MSKIKIKIKALLNLLSVVLNDTEKNSVVVACYLSAHASVCRLGLILPCTKRFFVWKDPVVCLGSHKFYVVQNNCTIL